MEKIKFGPLLLVGTALGILFFAIYVMLYLGAFKEVKLEARDMGPYNLLFHHHTGPYHEIIKSIEKLETWAKTNQVNCETSFGEYLDDPEQVDEGRLQSNGGCIIKDEELKLLTKIPDDVSQRQLEKKYYLTAEFDGAPSLGPIKIYPKAKEWMKLNNFKIAGPIIEIYKMEPNQKIHTTYLFPLGK